MMKKTLQIMNNIIAILIQVAVFPFLIGMVSLYCICYLILSPIKLMKTGPWWSIVIAINRFEEKIADIIFK